ncbi:Qri5 [Kluyveromyces lactis]|nr:Qri5 [Kluyveromyces lactis]
MLRSITTRLASPISGSLRCLSVACCNTQMAAPMGMPIGMTAGIPTGSLGLPVQGNNHMTEPTVSITDLIKKQEEYRMDSVMRKRRTKMKKHKLRKRRKRQKAEKRKQSQG